ncbi:hypothetical protein DCE94_02175 [Agromyces badenianii]|nr:hypothetical protein DCE94_02175 [Agromyces badenianii]
MQGVVLGQPADVDHCTVQCGFDQSTKLEDVDVSGCTREFAKRLAVYALNQRESCGIDCGWRRVAAHDPKGSGNE